MNENDFDGDRPRQLMVCTLGVDCARALKERDGASALLADALKEARTNAGLKRELYVTRTGCQGWCQHAPVAQLLPEGRIFSGLRLDEAAKVVKACAQGGFGLEDHVIWDYSLTRAQNVALGRVSE